MNALIDATFKVCSHHARRAGGPVARAPSFGGDAPLDSRGCCRMCRGVSASRHRRAVVADRAGACRRRRCEWNRRRLRHTVESTAGRGRRYRNSDGRDVGGRSRPVPHRPQQAPARFSRLWIAGAVAGFRSSAHGRRSPSWVRTAIRACDARAVDRDRREYRTRLRTAPYAARPAESASGIARDMGVQAVQGHRAGGSPGMVNGSDPHRARSRAGARAQAGLARAAGRRDAAMRLLVQPARLDVFEPPAPGKRTGVRRRCVCRRESTDPRTPSTCWRLRARFECTATSGRRRRRSPVRQALKGGSVPC